MFLKKVLNQPNLVGTVMIALLIGSGFVYTFAFDGFNLETVTGGEVEAWLAAAGDGSSGGSGGGEGDGGSGGGEGDPPEDREEGEVGTDPCDCYKNLPKDMHTHALCSCGNKTWSRPKKSGKKKNGGWFNPCSGLKDYPCGKSKTGGSTCKGRNKHQTSGIGHCPCPAHPTGKGKGRAVWKICDSTANNSKTKCNDKCWTGIKN